jgi:hypothetical protein
MPERALDAGTVDGMHLALKILWTIYGVAVAINVTVWLLVSLSEEEAEYFWPMWLAVPGVVLFVSTVAVERMRGQKRRPH